MNRIDKTFQRLRQEEGKALIGFVTAGDPTEALSLEIIEAMCGAGLDLLEFGVPFSDPTADGPVIQRASDRARKQGITLERVLEMAAKIRKKTSVPIVVFSYYNPIYILGAERFAREAASAGVDGVLVVDLPPEESDELVSRWPDGALALIRLVAPTTPDARMARISEGAAGFLYLFSKTGVTGSGGLDPGEIRKQVARLRKTTRLPVCVGFGISTADHVAAVAAAADGVVIGSAFEKLIEENLEAPDLPSLLADKVLEFKLAATPKPCSP